MTDRTVSHTLFIIDRSGSMQSIQSDTQGGYETYLVEQAKAPGTCYVSLAEFDTEFHFVYRSKLLADVPSWKLVPRSMTALHDAIGRAVTTLGEELAALPEDKRPGAVEVVVMTDGYENASREWTAAKVKELITEQQEKYSWKFTFMGANQDAVLTGAHLGFNPDYSLTYAASSTGVENAFRAAATNSSTYRSMTYAGTPVADAAIASAYTAEQREAATQN